MPPPPRGTAAVVLGDRESRSADPWVASAAADIVRRHGFGSSLNHPFAGGHVVERHGRPSDNIHALQLEIDRRSYLDHRLSAPGPGFDRVARLVDDIAVHLGEALLRRRYATAAE